MAFMGRTLGHLGSPGATTVWDTEQLSLLRSFFSSASISVLFGSLIWKSNYGNGMWKNKTTTKVSFESLLHEIR